VLEPIDRPDLVDDVISRIRRAIFEGTLAPGERLVEDDLATKLGVSRAPVRDALKALERDGLVVSAGRRGKIVTSLSSHDAWEVYGLRATLEAMAFRLVMQDQDSRLIATLDAIVDEMRAASRLASHATLSALDVEFHERVCRAANHERLLRAWSEMSVQIRLLSLEVIDTLHPDLVAVPDRHAMLVRAIESGDADAAERAVRAHIDSVAQRVIHALQLAQREDPTGRVSPAPEAASARELVSERR
jgi:DNA-binding GntR family transcriptional regulator